MLPAKNEDSAKTSFRSMFSQIVSAASDKMSRRDRRSRAAEARRSPSGQPRFQAGNKRSRKVSIASTMDVALESRVLLTAAPVVDLNGAGGGVDFSAELNGPDVLIVAATATVTDADSANLVSATATITNFQSGDNLAVTDVVGITSLFAAGTLTLTGSATTADYQTVLQSLTFSSTSTDTTARTYPRNFVFDRDFEDPVIRFYVGSKSSPTHLTAGGGHVAHREADR